jgi:hypothetical protein
MEVTMKALTVSASIIALSAMLFAVPAFAISDEDACIADGGIRYEKEGGTGTCIYPVGNSDNTKQVTQKGSFSSSHDEGYVNPNGNEPPGQQGGDNISK